MNLAELEHRLEVERINPSYYSLEGGDQEGRLCIEQTGGLWHVYFSERGVRWDDKAFATEQEAADYFLNVVLADPSYRDA